MTIAEQIKQARLAVNAEQFGTDAWEAAMQKVRSLVQMQSDASQSEEFCSVDSGVHRTRLFSGRIINTAA